MDNKTFIDRLAQELSADRETVESLVSSLAGIVGEKGAEMDSVSLTGFGTFEPKKRMERVAVHPATGAKILVPPKIVIGFRPAANLKQKIRNGKED